MRTKHLDVLAAANPNQHNYEKLKLSSNTKGKSTVSIRARFFAVEDERRLSHDLLPLDQPSRRTELGGLYCAATSPPLTRWETRGSTRKYTLHTKETLEDNRICSIFQARSQKGSRFHEFCKLDRNTNPWKERGTETKKIKKNVYCWSKREISRKSCVRVCMFAEKQISAIARTIPRWHRTSGAIIKFWTVINKERSPRSAHYCNSNHNFKNQSTSRTYHYIFIIIVLSISTSSVFCQYHYRNFVNFNE